MNETEIEIQVLLFGACREAAQTGQLSCTVPVPATIALAWEQIKQQYPDLGPYERHALFALNEEHARLDAPLNAGDTLAIFPPVSGG